MKISIIPTRAVQEFFDELDALIQQQPAEWQAIPAGQKELVVSQSNFDYYLTIRQQYVQPAPIDTDEKGLPILYFMGIRVKPLPDSNRPTL